MKRAVIGDGDWTKLNGNSLGIRQNEEREKKTHKKSLAFCSQRGMNGAKSILIISVIAVGLLVDWFEFFT